MSHLKKAVVLSSGGLDSTTAMAIAKFEGFEIFSLSFSYGQRHAFELKAAQKVANALGVTQHLVINIDLNKIGGSSLTDDIDVPKKRDEQEMTRKIPVTYVPARNTRFSNHLIFSSGLTQSTTAVIRTAGLSISTHLNVWQILPQRRVWKA